MSKFYNYLIATIFLILPCLLYAEDIRCTADYVSSEFSETGEPVKTIFEGNVKVIYGNITIESEKAIFDHKSNQLIIDNGVRLSQDKFSVSSGQLTYDFNLGSGDFINSKFYYDPFYGRAGIVWKKRDEICADTCVLTTCDKEKPHYYLSCAKIKLTQEKITIKNLKIYLGKVPVFYFPGYTYDIKMRKPVFLISGGYKTELGNSLSLIFNNALVKNTSIEMQEKIDIGLQGIGAGLTIQDSTLPDTTSSIKKFHSYAFKKYGNSDLSYGFISEFQNEFAKRQNVILDWRWMKDNKFFRKHLYDEYIEKSKNPNYFSYSRPAGNGIFSVRIIDSAHEEFISLARIPEIEFSIPAVKTGRFLSSFDIMPSRFVDRDGNEWTRIFSEAELEMPLSAGFMKITPFIKLRNIFYMAENEDFNNFIFSPGVNFQFLAGRFSEKSAVYFSPSFSIYANYPSEKQTNFSFDLRDFNPDGIFSSLNLAWDFWHRGNRYGNIVLTNLYDATRTQFSDSILTWNFNPDRRWSIYGQERFNFSKGGIREMTNCVVFKEKDIHLGIGNSYLSGYFDGISVFCNKKKGIWEFGFSVNYDIRKNSFTSQKYYIRKQFHCLTAGIMYSKTSTTYVGIFLMPSVLGSK